MVDRPAILHKLTPPATIRRAEANLYLVKVIQSLVEVSQHSCRGLVGDFDGRLQDALWDDMTCSISCWLSGYVHPVGLMAALAKLLKLLVQLGKPLLDKVNILERENIIFM